MKIVEKIPYNASIKLKKGETLKYDVFEDVLYEVDCGGKKYKIKVLEY